MSATTSLPLECLLLIFATMALTVQMQACYLDGDIRSLKALDIIEDGTIVSKVALYVYKC